MAQAETFVFGGCSHLSHINGNHTSHAAGGFARGTDAAGRIDGRKRGGLLQAFTFGYGETGLQPFKETGPAVEMATGCHYGFFVHGFEANVAAEACVGGGGGN